MPRSDVEVDTTRLDRILANLDGNVADNLAAVGFSVEAKAKVNIQRMHAIDTGALLNSVYTRTASGQRQNNRNTSFGAIESEVHGRNPDALTVELPAPESNHTVHVGPSVNYAIDVHGGTTRMVGRPFLAQAVRDVESELAEAMGDAITDGR